MPRSPFFAVTFALAGMILLVSLASPRSFFLDAFQIQLSLQIFDQGYTQISLPPVGQVRARTHLTPLKLNITLKGVDLDLLKRMVDEAPAETGLVQQIRTRLVSLIQRFLLWVMFLSGVGGAFGLWVMGRRNIAALLKGAVVGLTGMAVLVAGSVATYDVNAFRQPQYTGVLRAAPWMVGLVEESVVKVRQLGQQLELMADNLSRLYGSIERLEPLGTNRTTLKVLAVSDIHNNPAAIDLMQGLVRTFGVDFVVDTGDISDFGTPLEASLVRRLGDLGVPYVFAAGNHDSPEILSSMRRIPNVILLEGRTVTVKEIPIMGLPDPSSARLSPAVASRAEIEASVAEIRRGLAGSPVRPLVLAVHLPQVAFALGGEVPVILYGHTHSPSIRQERGSAFINPGTTGASGLRGLQATQEVPFGLALLHFVQEAGKWKLLAADAITLFQVKSGFTLERTLFDGNQTGGKGRKVSKIEPGEGEMGWRRYAVSWP